MEAFMLGYFTILAAAVSGLTGVSWWAAIVAGCLLALQSIIGHQQFYHELKRAEALGVLSATAPISLVSGCLASGAAFALGRASGWLWGL
jgi:hypothetical protein